MDDDEILSHLKAQGDKKRKHATFFDWHDRSASGKGVAESGIVDELLDAMQAQGRSDYRNLGASAEEWPDVWLQEAGGRRVACEVSELVDEAALPAGHARTWTATELIDRLQAKIDTKGLRSLGGLKGDKSILLIHTDEPTLNAENASVMLTDVSFKKASTIGRVFFLLSYDPNRGGYRYFELQLAA
jgi:hypothetical protein